MLLRGALSEYAIRLGLVNIERGEKTSTYAFSAVGAASVQVFH
jgi:hypothetical protein